MYNQNQLPFSTDRQEGPFLNLTLNSPPFVPQWQGDPMLQNVLPAVAAATALEIQNNANRNPMRMFMFNMQSRNNFANDDFSLLVCTIMDFITMGLMDRTYMNVDQAWQDAVPRMVEMICALNMKMFPALERTVDQQTNNAIRNTIAHVEGVLNAIASMKQRMQFGGGGGPGYGPSQGWNQGGGWNQRSTFTGGGYPPPGVGYGRATPSNVGGGGTSLFMGGGSNVNFPQPFASSQGRNMGGSKYDMNYNPNEPYVARETKQYQQEKGDGKVSTQQTDVSIMKEVPAAKSSAKWKPTATQPYFPAINPIQHEMFYVLDGNNNVVELKIRERDGLVMDYERHKLPTVFGLAPQAMDFSNNAQVIANLEAGIKNLNEAVTAVAEETKQPNDPEIEALVNPAVIIEPCLAAAWLTGEIDRFRYVDGELPFVYRTYARVGTPILSDRDETDIVLGFGNAGTFIKLRDMIVSSYGVISIELWSHANKLMTQVINRILKQNMSLPDLTIDSFEADIQDLIEYLGKTYGDLIQNSFLRDQKQYIAATFQTMYPESADDMTHVFLDGMEFPGESAPKITYVSNDFCLTYLNCSSFDLNIDLSKTTSAALTRIATPMMYDLVHGMFMEKNARVTQFDRHLIRTNDGRILEATIGAINSGKGEKFYLLTLVE